MARIPVYEERQQVSRLMSVPQLSAPDTGAGAIGRSMQQVGSALSQVSQTIAQTQNRQAQTWATETSSNELLYWSNRSEELKTTVGKGGAGYFQALNKEFQERAEGILSTAPDGQSRRFLSQNFLNLRQSLLNSAIQFEVVEGRAAQVNEFRASASKIALAAAQTKDPVLAQQSIGQMKAQIQASNLLPRQKEELISLTETTVASAYASSVVRENPSAAVAILSQNAPKIQSGANLTKLFAAMQEVESGNNPKAVSPVGATGLMQVMPATAMDPGFGLPSIFEFAESKGVPVVARNESTAKVLLTDSKLGAEYGQAYMKAMLARYDNNVVPALAAYNWGPGRTDEWVARGANMDELPAETKKYIPDVLNRSGITMGQSSGAQDSIFAMLPLGEQLKFLQQASENQSAQMIESTAGAVWQNFGPQSDTDPVELDLLNDHIDVLMADRTVAERKTAKSLMKSYADSHKQSSGQRQAERVSGIWTNVMNGAPMAEIQTSPEWKALDGTEQKKLITEINTFRTQPTQPAQWAMYSDISGNKQELASMSTEQILAMSPMLGNELTTKLIQERAKLNSPEDIGKAEYDEDSFKVFASKAGLKVFETKAKPKEKERIGQFRFAVENALVIRSNELRRPLSRAEQDDVMTEVLSNKVYVDEFGRDPEVIMALVDKDDMGDTYVVVGSKQVYLKEIPASSRGMIIRQLRSAGMPVTEAAIAEVYLAAQQQRDPRFEQIPQ